VGLPANGQVVEEDFSKQTLVRYWVLFRSQYLN
jgi:hypothetical protein